MKIIKKINNNVVLALTEQNEEVIIVGKGLGFHKTPYELDDESLIEKIYVIPKNSQNLNVLDSIPTDIIEVTEKIVRYGSDVLNKKINSAIFLGLCDHINYAVQRCRDGVQFKSPLYWEVKNVYAGEYSIGMEAVHIINKELNIEMSSDEAVFIALHFVNVKLSLNDMSETTKITSIIGEILNIVKYYFKIDFDEDSFNFRRFVTHIRYFILRQINNETLDDNNEFMYEIMKKKCAAEYGCVKKIEKHLLTNYNWKCSSEEKLYLIMHLQRLRSRQKNK